MQSPYCPGRRSIALLVSLGTASMAMAGGVPNPQPKMGDPLPGLSQQELDRFLAGQIDYNTPLLESEGLGPVFNKDSCGNCHSNPLGGPGSQSVFRFGAADKGSFDPLDAFGGSLLQASSIDPTCAETIPPEANVIAQRVTPGMLGYGLVEAILDADILALEQPIPGVSGRAHLVDTFENPGTLRVGRFGWKAQVPTILTFAADAAQNEMGLTNRFLPTENDPNGINPPSLMDCDVIADPEDGPDLTGRDFIDRITDFQRFLAAPPQTPKSGMTGEVIFNNIGCAECHTPSFTTANDPSLEAAISNQTIRPYSDFLLHDVGVAADFIPQGGASEREIRTPPLWGVRSRDPLWHDGRFGAGTFESRVTNAIQEHGVFGAESVDSFNAWNALSGADKALLVDFLNSLGRAEFDEDGDNEIELVDFFGFKACYGGGPYTPDDPCAVHDIDQDGDVDLDDFGAFLTVYEDRVTDCNNNGIVDLEDILVGTGVDADNDGVIDDCCTGDIDQDGEVGFNDLVEMLAVWGPCGLCAADVTADGFVDFDDLVTLLAAWGSCS